MFIVLDSNLYKMYVVEKFFNLLDNVIGFEEEIYEIENIIWEFEEGMKKSKINVNSVGLVREKVMFFFRVYF